MVGTLVRFCRVFHRRRVFTFAFFFLSGLSCLWYFGFVLELKEPIEYHHVRFGEHNECAYYKSGTKASNAHRKLILFYTTIFDRIVVFHPDEYKKCCEPFNCEITTDKSRLLESDAIVFHGRDLPKGKDMPKQRTAKQRWVFFSHESPYHSKLVTREYNGMFNWTMTYERRADVFEPYGYYSKKIPGKNEETQRNYADGKDKLLIYINGHCQTVDGFRENFMRALNKITKVDIHGKCAGIFGRLTCPRKSERCQNWIRRHKFYISFENSICEDYVSEKYWDVPLDNDLVPVIFGTKFFKELAIPGSYIDATKFPDVHSLVKYLKYLDQNDTAYNEYFKWTKFYQKTNREPWPCRLCRMLHNDMLPVKSYKRFDEFHDPNIVCRKLGKDIIKF